jgi:hypothetical protein
MLIFTSHPAFLRQIFARPLHDICLKKHIQSSLGRRHIHMTKNKTYIMVLKWKINSVRYRFFLNVFLDFKFNKFGNFHHFIYFYYLEV